LSYAPANTVHLAKLALRSGVTLFRRLAKPEYSLLVVFVYAETKLINHAKLELRSGASLVCRFAIPVYGLLVNWG
jgi:hypothetical protein